MARRVRNAVSTVAEKIVKQCGPDEAIKLFKKWGNMKRHQAAFFWAEPGFGEQAKEADHDAYCCDLAIIYIRQKWGLQD